MNKRDDYLHAHLYGCVNDLVAHLGKTGVLEVPAWWDYQDSPEREIFSWWLVSDNMARRLKEAGYCILDFEEEIYLWGRTTHGIAIWSDASVMKALGF